MLLTRQDRALFWQRFFVFGLFGVFSAVAIQYYGKVLDDRSAVVRFLYHVSQMDAGENIYVEYSYPHPPVFALFLKQLAKLPTVAGAMTWFFLKLIMALASMHWAFKMIETPDRPFPIEAKVFTAVLCLKPIIGDLTHGNINLFVLFLLMAALHLFQSGWDRTSGMVLGLAIVCRLTPLLFVPYLVWKRAWRSLAGCAVGVVFFAVLLPGILLGPARNTQLLLSWADCWITPYLVGGEITSEHENQSLPGFVMRMATASPSYSKYITPKTYVPVRYDNILELTPTQARWIIKFFMGLFAILVIWTCRTPISQRQGWRLPAEFSIVLLGMLLFCERTWKHHCVLILLPSAVLSYYLHACRPEPGLRRYLVASAVAAFVLMMSTSTSLLGSLGGKQAEVYGAFLWANVVLASAIMVLLRRKSQEAEAAI
ncbi:MAG: hypothetical protein KatS3mg105_2245 [Gemmatales bacterium]|nr:MAG: hypothetical protein KatS3mg105_2245 [Gemmatales bacterium]